MRQWGRVGESLLPDLLDVNILLGIPAFRLKILKDEIRKSYFLELKRFLWKEGIQGPDDEVKGPSKVYPMGE